MREVSRIDWKYGGPTDLAVGTGAEASEKLIVYGASVIAACAFAPLWLCHYQGWDWWIYVVCAIFAFDIAGGVVANATNSCKRFYQTPSKPDDPAVVRFLKSGINFDLLHLHPVVLALLVPGASALNGFSWYLGLILSVLIVRQVPLYLRRPSAFAIIVVAIVVNLYVLPLGPGLEWVMPLMFLKIVYGHTVQEEPYRPTAA
ncbi:MAG: hypothetical protein ACK54F_05175 [Planctomycetia bacterium]|jgi:hypothetical protein